MTGQREHEARLKAYHVEERLTGAAWYTIIATSAAEAREKLKTGDCHMDDSHIDHTGVARIRRVPSEDPS